MSFAGNDVTGSALPAAATPAARVRPSPRVSSVAASPGSQSRPRLLLAVCCVAQFMVILDVSIVNVALPSIRTSLGFSATDLQWIVNAYTIAFAGFLMLADRTAKVLGQRRTFVAGIVVFSLASLAGGLAATQTVLVAARAAQGLGGAIMASASLAVIVSAYAPGRERHRAVGLWGAMNGAGGAAGTFLGGVITQELGWHWIFLINVPVGIAAAIVAHASIPERHCGAPERGFDIAGAVAVTVGLLTLVYGIVAAGSDGWGSLAALGPIVLGLALLAAFAVIEGRFARVPLLPLSVFASQPLRLANGVVLLLSAALFPMWYFASLYMQEVLHMTPLATGLAFLPMALTIMFCARRAGLAVARVGARRVLGSGLTLMAIGLALFSRVAVDGSYALNILVPGLLVAAGIGFSIVPSTIAATVGAPPSQTGLASGLINTSRQMGGALGLAILTALAAQYSGHLLSANHSAPVDALNGGFRLAFLLAAVLAAVSALMTFRLMPALHARQSAGGGAA